MIAWPCCKDIIAAAMSMLFAALVAQPVQAQQCATEAFEKVSYVVCSVDPAASDLRLFWKNSRNEPYRTFSGLARALRNQGHELVFAVNAGMYQSDFSPLGLFIEEGEELRPANTTTIEAPPREIPNFYKKPNGIFFLGEAAAGILPTDAFLKLRPRARFATQSGPMLVIENELHPAFIAGSSDLTRRSGVGVCKGGQVRFAISDGSVNFHDFARLFRDRLACPNALFLDGGRGVGLYLPSMRRNDFSWHGGYGPIFGLVE
ncbi:MAG: phosphodiester glycosidase family protein [Rhizobiales bacterium]|nr:phosphodiester glycosidase family protein [Hyphomicrobiales bacterium]